MLSSGGIAIILLRCRNFVPADGARRDGADGIDCVDATRRAGWLFFDVFGRAKKVGFSWNVFLRFFVLQSPGQLCPFERSQIRNAPGLLRCRTRLDEVGDRDRGEQSQESKRPQSDHQRDDAADTQ